MLVLLGTLMLDLVWQSKFFGRLYQLEYDGGSHFDEKKDEKVMITSLHVLALNLETVLLSLL